MAKSQKPESPEKNKHEAGKKDQALDRAVSQIEKKFGKGSTMRLGTDQKLDVPVISTGSLSLDMALGVGGMPRGRVVEVFGPESSGKTTLTLHVVANAQKQGGTAAFIDVEHALDPDYAKRLGVNLDTLSVNQPDTGAARQARRRSAWTRTGAPPGPPVRPPDAGAWCRTPTSRT